MSKKVAEIWCDAPVKLNLEEVDGHNIDVKELRDLLQKLEFRSLLNNLPANMRSQAPKEDFVGGVKLELPKNVLINSNEKLKELKLPDSEQVFVYSRSGGKHGKDPHVLILSTDGKTSFTIDFTKVDPKLFVKSWSKLSPLVGHDVKATLKFFKALGIEDLPEVGHDVLVGAFLINALVRAQTLTDLAANDLKYEGAALEDLPPEDVIDRAPEFIAIIRELYLHQKKQLKELPKIQKVADDIDWPVESVLADMEYEGIGLDVGYLKNFSKKIDKSIADLEQQIYKAADHEFNIGSPGQLAEVLFTKLNLPTQGIKKGKTGYSTAASELDKLRGLNPVIDLITQWREVTKLKNTYVDTLPLQVDENSKLHTTFGLTGSQTGRLNSSDPNLMNIPVRTELGKNIRTAFVAGKGNVFISADYSQFEIRVAAALSGDKGMIDAFNRDADIHIETAALVYGIKPEEVTKQQRYEAKAVNFGTMYGQGPHALSLLVGIDFGAAREFIRRYFEVRPKLKEYIDKTKEQAKEQGYVENIFGRRRPTPDVNSSNFAVREAGYRAAVNMPLQGTAADLMKMAMVQVAGKLPKEAKLLLQIHDSILVEVPEKQAEATGKIIKETMENVYKLPVKLKADISVGKNWGEL